jgi:hypothetical protein
MIEASFTCRLGRDAELRHIKNGTLAMCSFSAAVENGPAADAAPTVWVRVVTFGEKVEELAPRLLKARRSTSRGGSPLSSGNRTTGVRRASTCRWSQTWCSRSGRSASAGHGNNGAISRSGGRARGIDLGSYR